MLNIKEIILVEGKYDKIKLESIVNATIITTEGFKIFKDKEKQKYLKSVAEKRGIIILTDSDKAGIKIRNFLKNIIDKSFIKHAYVPEILGKERRKTAPSKSGFIGVEGVEKDIILAALATVVSTNCDQVYNEITRIDFYNVGLTGKDDSSEKRRLLAVKLGVPQSLSTTLLLEYVNMALSRDEFMDIMK